MKRRSLSRQRGVTLILVAVCLFVLMGVAALAVDVGVMFVARAGAQHAADAAALAGAYTFQNLPTASQPATAQSAAVQIANQNTILGTQLAITAADVVVSIPDHRVTVTIPRTTATGNPVATYFANIFGVTNVDVSAVATAEASLTPTAGRCIKPIYIPNTALSALPTADAACKAGPAQIMFNASGGLSDWMKTQPNNGLGQQMTLKPNSPPGALVPGQYYVIDFGSGANTYRCTWAKCLNDPTCGADINLIKCGNQYPVKTGNMVGPTKQGVEDLICGPSGNCHSDPADIFCGLGQYAASGGACAAPYNDHSRSLQIAPVWDNCAQVINPGTNGQQVQIVGFAEIFVDGITGQNVVGHLINPLGCDIGSSSTSTGPLAVPIRLVQTPTQ